MRVRGKRAIAATARAIWRRGCSRLLPSPTYAIVGIARDLLWRLFAFGRSGAGRAAIGQCIVAVFAAAAARASALFRRFVGLQHRLARGLIGMLELRPPVDQRARDFTRQAAKLEEVVGGAKARML